MISSFGGLNHVLNLTENINILVLDTQGYSNTGGLPAPRCLLPTALAKITATI